jgi:molecular chaperone HtpG
MFKTTTSDEYKTLKEYINEMKDGQKFIYYASGKTKEAINALPQMDLIKKHEFDVLLFTDEIDEFMVNILHSYDEFEFKSVSQGDLDLLDDTEKEELEQITKESESLLSLLKESLKDQVTDVTLSKRLTDSPVCIVSGEGVSMEMEKVLSNMPQGNNVKASKILEINPNHELFTMLQSIYESDQDKVKKYATLLYNQALLIEGMKLDSPVEFSNLMVQLMIDANK